VPQAAHLGHCFIRFQADYIKNIFLLLFPLLLHPRFIILLLLIFYLLLLVFLLSFIKINLRGYLMSKDFILKFLDLAVGQVVVRSTFPCKPIGFYTNCTHPLYRLFYVSHLLSTGLSLSVRASQWCGWISLHIGYQTALIVNQINWE